MTTYLAPERWRKDLQTLRERIVAAIDRACRSSATGSTRTS